MMKKRGIPLISENPEVRSQKSEAGNRKSFRAFRSSFWLLAPDFWILIPALCAILALTSCDQVDDPAPVQIPQGTLIQDFPLINAAVWSYQNADDPTDRYRVTVNGTRQVSGQVLWKLEYEKLDTLGSPPPIGTPIAEATPLPSDFYSANGLHFRLTALTLQPGIFSRAVFIGGLKAASIQATPIASTYLLSTVAPFLNPLDSDQNDPMRYEEIRRGTLGEVIEYASEGVTASGLNFQKHLPPRRLWQFPLTQGARWVVFRLNEISRGPTAAPQPAILGERRVKSMADAVATPGYTGDAILVEEWVLGIRKDEKGNPVIPSLDDTNGDGVPERGNPTARYWFVPKIGVVKYEYELVDIGPPAAFVRKTYVLTNHTIPQPSE